MSRELFTQTPLRQITRADGVAKEIRVQDGHLFVCNGCCCGRTEKGFPALQRHCGRVTAHPEVIQTRY